MLYYNYDLKSSDKFTNKSKSNKMMMAGTRTGTGTMPGIMPQHSLNPEHFDNTEMFAGESTAPGLSSLPVSVMPGSSLAPPMHAVKPTTAYNTNVLAPPTPSNPLTPESKTSLSDTMSQSEYAPLGCFPKDQLTSADLLPKQGGWEASNPAVPLSSLSGANFLTSGTMYGINTTGSSLRNANLQLRSDPCIPRMNVGPWSQSTIESDNNRKYLEIGNA
jgi:hypothetical protein